MKQKGISASPLAIDVSQGSDQMWDFWMYNFASGGHLPDQAGDPTFPDNDKVPQAILEWWVAAANDWKIFNAQANMEELASGALTPMRTQGTQPGYGGGAAPGPSPHHPRGAHPTEPRQPASPTQAH